MVHHAAAGRSIRGLESADALAPDARSGPRVVWCGHVQERIGRLEQIGDLDWTPDPKTLVGNFNAIGQYSGKDEAGFPVDASGKLADGSTFTTPGAGDSP